MRTAVRGGSVDLLIEDGVIAEAGPSVGAAPQEIDATGLLVLPGCVDGHLHFNDPGRADWEGFATGTAALVAGGTTTGVDMPLNAIPPTTTRAGLEAKLAAAQGRLHADMALWGGIAGQPLDELDALAEAGVVGVKAFMSASGVDEFPAVDDEQLLAGMRRAAALGLLVSVHAEDDALTARLTARARADGRTSMADYLTTRPIEAETAAISRALALAAEAGCALHVVHVSSAAGVRLVTAARQAGQDVTCETCPHYLVLDAGDARSLGVVAKCAPPLREADEVAALWRELRGGHVDYVATDHSPAPAELKGGTALDAWGGISGAQMLLTLMLDAGLEPIVERLADAPARRLGLAGKGRLEPGFDADVVLVDPDATRTLATGDLLDRHKLSPYLGRVLRGRVTRTLLRGQTVARDGALVGPPGGRILRATR